MCAASGIAIIKIFMNICPLLAYTICGMQGTALTYNNIFIIVHAIYDDPMSMYVRYLLTFVVLAVWREQHHQLPLQNANK